MKKHIVGVIIALVVIILSGVLLWMFVFKKNDSDLYSACSNYIHSEDTSKLQTSLQKANSLYTLNSKGDSSEKRLLKLGNIIEKINIFQLDITSYLTLDSKKTSKISKSYKSLEGSREYLLEELDTYITRMSGNTLASSSSVANLYNDIVKTTTDFVQEYNKCFNSSATYVFEKVYTTSNIKNELYSLYSACVDNLISTSANYQFPNMPVLDKLNSKIILENNCIKFASSISGGEFSEQALKFKHYFGQCSVASFANNFIDNSANSSFDPETETSTEKLTMYYLKQILEM